MIREEFDLNTGERRVIPLTPQEIAEAQARQAAMDAEPKQLTLEERVAILERNINART